MSGIQLAFAGLLVSVILLQAILPAFRLLIVLVGAAVSCGASAYLGLSSVGQLFREVPWEVLVILVALGLYAQNLADSRLFGLASVRITRAVRARPTGLLLLFTLGTYFVSGVINNLTALLVILPVLLSVFALVGVTRRFASWTLGVMLVACNLGGAATPIGDFPAVLLLGSGVMTFGQYMVSAAPPTFFALLLLLFLVIVLVRPARDVRVTPATQGLTLAILDQIYRGIRLRWSLLGPSLLALVLMLVGWLWVPAAWGFTPELVCWVGAGVALLARPRHAEQLLRTKVDVEASLFLLAFFLMVGAVRGTGFFAQAAGAITQLPVPPGLQVLAFLILAALLTGLFSAGPSMAALLEVAEVLAREQPAEPIFVGLALSVCAGSSLFLTAATSGPLTQAMVERAKLDDVHGNRIQFGFVNFLPVGLVSFCLILAVNLVRTWWVLSTA